MNLVVLIGYNNYWENENFLKFEQTQDTCFPIVRGEGDSGTELEKSESEYLIQLSYGNVTTFDMGGRHSLGTH